MHLAGIIPIAGFKSDFGTDFPEVLLPVDAGYSMIQKSVFECAIAGCETIWIVANDDLAPIIREQVGEWIHDPVWYYRYYEWNPMEHQKEIPIYYVPIHPKDRDRRDSHGWSVLHGIITAFHTARKISKWLTPDKYFISFPQGAHNVFAQRKHRKEISDGKKNFFLTHDGKTVKDNEYLSFTMFGEDFQKCRRHVNKETTKTYTNPPAGEIPSVKLPLEERWSARHFDFDTIFSEVSTRAANFVEPKWYYDISTWQGYRDYLASDKKIKKPTKHLIQKHKHVKIAYNPEEEE